MTKEQIQEFILRSYAMYPKKMGKTRGIEKLTKQLTTEKDCRDFFDALKKFTEYHSKRGTEADFLPYFSTFVSTWMDWLDDAHGSAIEFNKNFDHLFAGIREVKPKELE